MYRTPVHRLSHRILVNVVWVVLTPACHLHDKGDSGLEAPWIDVSAGKFLSCGVRGSGEIACWGHDGLIGDTGPDWVDYGDATPPEGRYLSVSLSRGKSETGSWHACALDDAREINCWGRDDLGQSSSPTGTFVQLALSSNATCALDEAGAISCWGYSGNVDGRPVGSGYQALAGGNGSLCALDGGGTVTCWTDPSTVAVLDDVWTAVSVYNKVCVSAVNQAIQCWSLYPPTEEFDTGRPTSSGHDQVCVGFGPNGCALTTDGALTCWGPEYLNTLNDESETYETAQTDTYQKVSCGLYHACGLTTSGEIRCWGSCKSGECTVPP